jgi:hypothetical protein
MFSNTVGFSKEITGSGRIKLPFKPLLPQRHVTPSLSAQHPQSQAERQAMLATSSKPYHGQDQYGRDGGQRRNNADVSAVKGCLEK